MAVIIVTHTVLLVHTPHAEHTKLERKRSIGTQLFRVVVPILCRSTLSGISYRVNNQQCKGIIPLLCDIQYSGGFLGAKARRMINLEIQTVGA